jgi:hypothetical protein
MLKAPELEHVNITHTSQDQEHVTIEIEDVPRVYAYLLNETIKKGGGRTYESHEQVLVQGILDIAKMTFADEELDEILDRFRHETELLQKLDEADPSP